jgi:hypothetical protein
LADSSLMIYDISENRDECISLPNDEDNTNVGEDSMAEKPDLPKMYLTCKTEKC